MGKPITRETIERLSLGEKLQIEHKQYGAQWSTNVALTVAASKLAPSPEEGLAAAFREIAEKMAAVIQ